MQLMLQGPSFPPSTRLIPDDLIPYTYPSTCDKSYSSSPPLPLLIPDELAWLPQLVKLVESFKPLPPPLTPEYLQWQDDLARLPREVREGLPLPPPITPGFSLATPW
jgi:hypothetical protein